MCTTWFLPNHPARSPWKNRQQRDRKSSNRCTIIKPFFIVWKTTFHKELDAIYNVHGKKDQSEVGNWYFIQISLPYSNTLSLCPVTETRMKPSCWKSGCRICSINSSSVASSKNFESEIRFLSSGHLMPRRDSVCVSESPLRPSILESREWLRRRAPVDSKQVHCLDFPGFGRPIHILSSHRGHIGPCRSSWKILKDMYLIGSGNWVFQNRHHQQRHRSFRQGHSMFGYEVALKLITSKVCTDSGTSRYGQSVFAHGVRWEDVGHESVFIVNDCRYFVGFT